jgi:hypothetical protein
MRVKGNFLNCITTNLMFKSILATAIMILFISNIMAQVSEGEIKLSQEYYWGEGTAESVEEARAMARKDMATRIITTIRADTRLISSEIDGKFTQSYVQNIQSESNLQIRGLGYMDIPRRNNVRSIAYIKIVDYYKQVNEQTDKVRASVRNARSIEIEQGLDKALPEYLSAWFNARFIPSNVFVALEQDSLDLNSLVRQKVRSWVDGINLKATIVDGGLINDTDVAINVQVQASYLGNPVDAAEIRWAESGYGFHKFLDGEASVFYDKLPSRTNERKRVLIAPSLSNLADTDPELKNTLAVEKSLDINFRTIVGVEIEILNNLETSLNLSALVSNLSVSRIEWFIGSTSIGVTQNITIPKSRLLSQPLSLVINRDTDLTVRRSWRNNQFVEISNTTESSTAQPLISSGIRELSTETITSNFFELEKEPLAKELVQIVEYQVLMNWLRSQSRVGNINFGAVGQQDTVTNYPGSYIVLVNPVRQSIVGVLSKEKDSYREIYGLNKRINDPAVEFQGQGVGSIWVQIN